MNIANIHIALNLAGITGYIFALITGFVLASHMREMNRSQTFAVVGSITTCVIFILCIVCWTFVMSTNMMDNKLALSFAVTHVVSSLALAMYHINTVESFKWKR